MILAEVRMMMVCADWRKDGWIEKKYLFQKRLENMLDKNIRRVPVAVPSRLVPADRCGRGPVSVRHPPIAASLFYSSSLGTKQLRFPPYNARTKGAAFPRRHLRSDVHRAFLQHRDQCKYRASSASSFNRIAAPPATATTPNPATGICGRKCITVQKTVRGYVCARLSAAVAYNLLSESLDFCKRSK